MHVAANVTRRAGELRMPPLEWERSRTCMVEARSLPVDGIVTTRAVGPAAATVHVVRRMALAAIERRAFERRVAMARRARNPGMAVTECEAGAGVVETRAREARRFVA